MKPSKNVEDLKNLKKDTTIAKRKHDKAINKVEVLRVKNKQMKKIGKKQSKKLLEKLCNDQDKTGKMFDLLDINVKSIEHLQSLKCGHDALPEGKHLFLPVKIWNHQLEIIHMLRLQKTLVLK